MDNDTTIPDADIVQDDSDVSADTKASEVEVLTNLESMIKQNVSGVGARREELKKFKDMLTSALANDETYRDHDLKAKDAAKVRTQTKAQILKQPANADIAKKIQDISIDIKEMDAALSDYLREYERLSGTNQIEDDDGDMMEIVYVAKLVKTSARKRI